MVTPALGHMMHDVYTYIYIDYLYTMFNILFIMSGERSLLSCLLIGQKFTQKVS